MKKILKENQQNFKLKLGPEEKTKKGFKYKKLYIFGNTYDFAKQLQSSGQHVKKYLGKYSGGEKVEGTYARFIRVFPDRKTGEYDINKTIDNNVKPYIEKVNEFYSYTLDVDKLLDELDNYVPTDDPETATKEEVNEIRKRLEEFKDKLLSLSTSEELQNLMKLMMDVKSGKSTREFSPDNKIAIKTQRPDATIVCNKAQWLDWYNRSIKPDAKPIFVNVAKSSKKNDPNITRNYLQKVGKSKYGDLSGKQREELHGLQTKSKYGFATSFSWKAFYDVKDTIQLEGTYDEIGADTEKAQKAAAELSGKDLSDIDVDTQTTTDDKIIKPVYNGLLGYIDAQNIKANVNIPNNITAASTKLLASALLSQILSGQLKGIASKASAEAKTPTARKQQAEVASWQFMDAFGVKYNLGDVDMSTIFGSPEPGKTPDEQKQLQKKQINNVLKDIAQAVNHLIDYVNIHIKENPTLTEIKDGVPQGKKVTANDIAKTLNIPNDMITETHKSIKLSNLFQEIIKESLNEANDIYFDTASGAADYARENAEKRGYEIDEDDWNTEITFGGKYNRLRPGEGKTHSYSIGLLKNGKPQRKALQISLYGMPSGKFELTHYIN